MRANELSGETDSRDAKPGPNKSTPDQIVDLVRLDVAVALLTIHQGRLGVLVVRDSEFESGLEHSVRRWSLPSAVVRASEDPRVVAEQLLVRLGVSADNATRPTARSAMFIEQLRTYAGPGRGTQRHSAHAIGEGGEGQGFGVGPVRVVSIAYVALVAELGSSMSRTPTFDQARIFAVDDLEGAGMLAFDHDQILIDAVERVRSKFEYTTVATSLVVAPFTIPELRRVYEAVWGTPLHQANFRRKVLATPGFVVSADELATTPGPNSDALGARDATFVSGTATVTAASAPRGPDLYEPGVAVLLHPAMLRPGGPGSAGTDGQGTDGPVTTDGSESNGPTKGITTTQESIGS